MERGVLKECPTYLIKEVERMKALTKVKIGYGGLILNDFADIKPAPDEIKVKIYAAGICGTDLHIWEDEYPTKPPVILGHEYSGIVAEIGKNVTEFKVGDPVISMTAAYTCGHCRYCNDGLVMLCPERKSIGSGMNGAMAPCLVVPSRLAFHIPAGVSLDEAALCEPFACAVRGALERGRMKAGDYVWVSGPGIIGQLVAQLALISGAKVMLAGTTQDKERLQLAATYGISTIDVLTEDVQEKVQEWTHGSGFDVAFECSGAAASSQTCLEVLRKNSLYVQIGLYGKKVLFDHDLALVKEIAITNSFGTTRQSWEIALRFLEQKKINLMPFISAKLPIEEWEKGFQKAKNKEGYKILLMPNQE